MDSEANTINDSFEQTEKTYTSYSVIRAHTIEGNIAGEDMSLVLATLASAYEPNSLFFLP